MAVRMGPKTGLASITIIMQVGNFTTKVTLALTHFPGVVSLVKVSQARGGGQLEHVPFPGAVVKR